jgi:putative aminopeptidase FrvX
MHDSKLDRLKELLAVPTFFRNEHTLLRYLVKYLKTTDHIFDIDDAGNLYITKGEADVYPLVCAHTDSVQPHTDIEIHEIMYKNQLRLIGKHSTNGKRCGIGADDKAGVFVCMELLRELPALKVALFSGEEFGCYGSHEARSEFFDDVGYAIEFDCPADAEVTYYCNGVKLFDKNGDFYQGILPVLTEEMGKEPTLCNHPYTDVWQLKSRFHFSCINIATGYHQYHHSTEYVVVNEVMNAIEMGRQCIEKLGYTSYPFKSFLTETNSFEQTARQMRYEYPDIFTTEPEPYRNILTE